MALFRTSTEVDPNILADAVEGTLELDEIRRGLRATKRRGAIKVVDATEGGELQ